MNHPTLKELNIKMLLLQIKYHEDCAELLNHAATVDHPERHEILATRHWAVSHKTKALEKLQKLQQTTLI